eukprot:1331786-Alexandrium_andersonii.AAC.1
MEFGLGPEPANQPAERQAAGSAGDDAKKALLLLAKSCALSVLQARCSRGILLDPAEVPEVLTAT